MEVQRKQEACNDRPVCDYPEPCACYAERYAAGSVTETGSRGGVS